MNYSQIRDLAMMFYAEETTQIEKEAPHEDRLLILDGTTCLDYFTEEADLMIKKRWLQQFIDFLTTLKIWH